MWQMWLVWRLWVLSKVTAAGLRQHYSVKTYISSYNSRYNYSYCIHICMNQPNPVWRNSSHYTPVFYSYYLLDVNERKDLIKHPSLLKRVFWRSIPPISTLKPCTRVPRPPPALSLLHVWKREASRVIEWENRSNQRRSSANEPSNRLFCELNFV